MTEEVSAANGKENKEEDSGLTELEQCIIRQVEYYFGDINLPRDKFLKEQIELDEGWVPYTTLLNFKRLAALSPEKDVISAALKKSKNQLMEISEDGEKLRRSPMFPIPELNEERRKELMLRTIYAKGLPKENTTIDECLAFFKKYSEPENVIMRRYLDKATKKHLFKGSVFVTFKTKEEAEKFLNEPSVKFNDVELLRLWQSKYLEEKKIEIDIKYNKTIEKKNAKKVENEIPSIVLPRGTVLIVKDVPENMHRDVIKEELTKLEAEVAFIKIDESKAWVRLLKEGSAKVVFDKITDGKLKVKNNELECELPAKDVEDEFLNKMAEELMNNKKNLKRKPNKFNNRKRKGGRDDGPGWKRNR